MGPIEYSSLAFWGRWAERECCLLVLNLVSSTRSVPTPRASGQVTPEASGQVERLERVVQGDCAAPLQLPLEEWRGAGAGTGTAPRHHAHVARSCRKWPGRGAGAGRDTAPQHHGYVVQPWLQCPVRGRRAGAGRGTAPEHHGYVAQPGMLASIPQSEAQEGHSKF